MTLLPGLDVPETNSQGVSENTLKLPFPQLFLSTKLKFLGYSFFAT